MSTETSAVDSRERPLHPLLWLFVLAVIASSLLVLLLTVVGFFARQSFRAEQICHFRLQYAWLLLIAATILLVVRKRGFAIAAGVGAAVNFAFVLPIYLPAEKPATTGKPWKLISYNVLGKNDRYADVLDLLRKEQADVVVLCEVKHSWAEQLKELRDLYPHQHIVAQTDNFGIALLSRVKWQTAHTREIGPAGVPSIVAEFKELGGRPYTIIGTHPLPPINRAIADARNKQLQALADFASTLQEPVILAGDLNVTNYSPYFRNLLRDAKLRDSRQGFGVQASWSNSIPLLFSIPIDHCLTSPSVETISRRIGPALGSDHCPVIVELR
jgi:endonuclease/exonuclease/phosphatase (EEP) superfamily protein YafD